MTALLYLGLSLSDSTALPTRYVPVRTFTFPANSLELEDAKRRCELIQLLADSIEQHARHEVNYKTEQRIKKLLKELEKDK